MKYRTSYISAICLLVILVSTAGASTISDLSRDLAVIAKQASPAAVEINVERSSPRFSVPGLEKFASPFQQPETVVKSVGSGFVIDPNGYILTTRDVVRGAKSISVKFSDGTTAPAKVMGTDIITDSAVIKVGKAGLRALSLGDSSALAQGMLVVMVNSQAGMSNSVSLGVVASTDRRSSPIRTSVIQISGTVGPGASGGAVLDTDGRAVAITFAMFSPTTSVAPFNIPRIYIAPSGSTKSSTDALSLLDQIKKAMKDSGLSIEDTDLSDNNGIGLANNFFETTRTSGSSSFAIPIDQIKPILSQLKSGAPINRAMLGLKLTQKDNEIVLDPVSGLPADKAGIKAGDVLVSANGRTFTKSVEFSDYVSNLKAGDRINMVVRRDGKDVPITIVAGSIDEASVSESSKLMDDASSAAPQFYRSFSLNLEDAGIAQVAKALSDASGKNVVVLNPESIKGKVTVHLRAATLESALSVICRTLSCIYAKDGDGYVIKPQ